MTPLVAGDLRYRDLPVNLYQVEWKYRDEFRPRYGLLRVREFLMKDAYSFDRDDEAMHVSYGTMMGYRRMFDRCGIRYVVVEADPGRSAAARTTSSWPRPRSARTCTSPARTATTSPTSRPRGRWHPSRSAELEPVTEVSRPGAATIAAVTEQLGVSAERTLKCILFRAGDTVVAALAPATARSTR